MIDRIPREPCQLCGSPLYYAEQWQSLCRSCADGLGITRLCDRRGELGATLDVGLYVDGGPNCRCHVGDLQFDEHGELIETFHGIDRTVALAGALLGSPPQLTLDIIRAEIENLIERKPD